MLAALLDLATATPWAYAALFAITAADGVVPVVPSEASVISAGALADSGELSIELVVVAGALGATAGDNAAYALGRMLGPRLEARIARGGKASARRDWAERTLRRRTATVIVLGRFLPGGRTATTMSAGVVPIGWPRFQRLSALAGVLWAAYFAALGFLGGTAFEDQPYVGAGLGLLVGVAAAWLLSVAVARRQRGLSIGDDTDATPGERS